MRRKIGHRPHHDAGAHLAAQAGEAERRAHRRPPANRRLRPASRRRAPSRPASDRTPPVNGWFSGSIACAAQPPNNAVASSVWNRRVSPRGRLQRHAYRTGAIDDRMARHRQQGTEQLRHDERPVVDESAASIVAHAAAVGRRARPRCRRRRDAAHRRGHRRADGQAGSPGTSTPSRIRPSRSRASAGADTPRAWIAAHTSWTKPGSVSSADRVPPPISSAASSTSTEQPASARRTAAASPLGPEPTTTASYRSAVMRLSPITGGTEPDGVALTCGVDRDVLAATHRSFDRRDLGIGAIRIVMEQQHPADAATPGQTPPRSRLRSARSGGGTAARWRCTGRRGSTGRRRRTARLPPRDTDRNHRGPDRAARAGP